jgi:hypothetical protein
MEPQGNVADARDRHRDELMRLAAVTGVGTGRDGDRDVVIVYLATSDPQARDGIPAVLDGFPVRCEVSGPLRAD